MEMLALLVGFGLLAVLAVRFGYDSRPGFRSDDERLVDYGQPRVDIDGDRRLALDVQETRRRRLGSARAADVMLDEEAFRSVSLSLRTDRSRAFAAALCRAATEERALGDGGWPGRAVDRLVRSVEVEHLGRVVDDLGLGQATIDRDRLDGAGAEAVRALLTHVMRDQLQDALRIQAGLRPFWTWDGPAEIAEHVATESAHDSDHDVELAAA